MLPTIKCFEKQWYHFSLTNLSNKIILSENEKVIINNQKYAEVFNNHFNSTVKKLNILIDQNLLHDASTFDYYIIAAIIHKHKRDPSILKIKEKIKKYVLFSFNPVNPNKMLKRLLNKAISQVES